MQSSQISSKLSLVYLLGVVAFFFIGCSKEVKQPSIPALKKDLNYGTQLTQSETSLTVPPQLVKPETSDLFNNDRQIIDRASRILSSEGGSETLIKNNDQVEIRRLGPYRWLEINSPSSQVFQFARQFLIDLGFDLTTNDSKIGLLETEWKENRPSIPNESLGLIRGFLSRSLNQVYSEDRIDRFRIRVERLNDDTSEVFISHQAMIQKDVAGTNTWVFADSEPEIEVELTYRFLVYLGLATDDAGSVVLSESDNQKKENEGELNLFQTPQGLAATINEPFARAWLMVGWSIDRSDYIIYDRNRTKGIFYIRLGQRLTETREGFLDRLMFWKEKNDLASLNVQVKLQTHSFDDSVQINILSEFGEKIPDEQAEIFLTDILNNI